MEDITFRTTKIRTFEKAILTIPNSILANATITNFSKRDARRVNFKLGIDYNTPPDTILTITNEIRLYLEKSEYVLPDSVICHLDSFADNSLEILMNFYINKSDWQEFSTAKELIYVDILKLLEKHKINIAFPTRTVYIKK